MVAGAADPSCPGQQGAIFERVPRTVYPVTRFGRVGTGGVGVKQTIQFRIFRGESQFVAECMDLGVVTQGRTLDEVAANIREAVALYLEGEDPAEFGLAPNAILVAVLELEQAA